MPWPSLHQLAWESGFRVGFEVGFRKGQLKEAKKLLRMWGDKELGPPGDRILAVIERLTDLEQLEDLVVRVPTARSWQGLLGPLLPTSQAAAALTLRPKVRASRRRALLCRRWTPVRRRT